VSGGEAGGGPGHNPVVAAGAWGGLPGLHDDGVTDARRSTRREEESCMSTILLIVLILLLIGALPTWPYSSGWGFYPSGGLGLVLLILLILVLTGRL
jgi:hypothetical protein